MHTPEEREVLFLEQVNDVLCDFQSRANRALNLRENIDETAQELLQLPRIAAAPAMFDALVAAKRELWDLHRHEWNLEDFKNFAVVQQIDAALEKYDGIARTNQEAK